MLDMSSSMPIFTTPSEILSCARAANAQASMRTAPIPTVDNLLIVPSRKPTLRKVSRTFSQSNPRLWLALRQTHGGIARPLPRLLPQQCLGHLAQACALHLEAVRALHDRERLHHHDPLRDLEPRQQLRAPRAQLRLVDF